MTRFLQFSYIFLFFLWEYAVCVVSEKVYYDFEKDVGGIPYSIKSDSMMMNTKLFSRFLRSKASGNALVIPDKTFYFYPGIYGSGITDFDLLVNGTIRFHRGKTYTNHYNKPEPGILIEDSSNIYITGKVDSDFGGRRTQDDNGDDEEIDYDYASSKRGIIDGHGSEYWGIPLVGYVQLGEFRPDLFALNRTENVLIEYMLFRDAALYTLHLNDMNGLKIRYVSVVARRTHGDGHSIMDLSAFNTDGIDVSGSNVHIHDVDIWNQDDCIAVKDAPQTEVSSNMLFERVTASGLGLTIGSIGGTTVQNITFRDSLLYKSYKGIYMKFRPDTWRTTPGLIEDVLFENITMIEPEQWGIWIGPAQQSISGNPCKASPCSLCWPTVPGAKCDGIKEGTFRNIVLKDVTIYNPLGSPGVILADESNPIDGISFYNVTLVRKVPQMYKNIRNTVFPGLQEPIHDSYNAVFFWIMIVTFCVIVLCGIVFSVVQFYRFLQPTALSDDKVKPLLENAKKDAFNRRAMAMIGLSVVIAVVVQRVIRTSERTFDKKHYFTCRGVQNGAAYGNTWPVPSCFEDYTTRSSS